MKKRTTSKPSRNTHQRRRTLTSPSDKEKIFKNTLFATVPPRLVSALLPALALKQYHAGAVIFDDSTGGEDLHLILGGKVAIKKYTKHGTESLLAVLHEGDFFGELSIINGLPRSACAIALEDTTTAKLSPARFRTLMRDSTAITMNLLRNLALRIRTLDETFVLELERNAIATRAQMDRLTRLIEASKIVNSSLELDRLLDLILTAATAGTDADRGTLYLIDTANGELWSKVAQGPNMVEIRLPIGKGLAGYVAKTGETANIAEAYNDPRFNPEVDKRSGYKTHNVLCMPMRNKEGTIVGVFQLLNKHGGQFTSDDEAFINALSIHASIAVENARLAQEMVRSERLSAVGRMANTIIHDIRNPMGSIRLYAQMLKKKAPDQTMAEQAGEIIKQVDRFVNMTREILDFSRGVSELNLEPISVKELTEAAVKMFAAEAYEKHVEVVLDLQYKDQCRLDVEKIVRVFYNLGVNALDAMPNGGSLTVRSRKQNGSVVFEFTDTGTGIPEEIRSKIFEPFFTFGKKLGTGLGLSIVRKIVEDHKGVIEIESEKNKGTTFRLFLPLSLSA
jgi:K+-sensing histidine kinase KdpD